MRLRTLFVSTAVRIAHAAWCNVSRAPITLYGAFEAHVVRSIFYRCTQHCKNA